jgi:eukaryotic-like serine/threonine-protein kinase
MNPDPGTWQRVREIFEGAVAIPPERRPSFVAAACGSDVRLREQVDRLLASHDRANTFLEQPAITLAEEQAGIDLAGRRIGPYLVQSRLGAGGMGEVYLAHDTRLKRPVAIKVLPPSVAANAAARTRFDREARAVAALSHPHICTLYDVGHDGGLDFLVMEYLEGESLGARLSRGPLPISQALQFATQIVSALDGAHRSGLVHRDLKPGNVMLTSGGAKLLDFGLAKPAATALVRAGGSTSVAPDVTTPGMILGTLNYMSPEQLEGRDVDARSDLFAFGCVFYEMLSGRKAFEGRSSASVVTAIMSLEPIPIADLQPLAPPGADYVIKRCLAKSPDNRWQTARDLLAELERTGAATEKRLSASAPPARAYQRAGWPLLVATGLAIASLAIVATVLMRARESASQTPPEPRFTQITAQSGVEWFPTLSPDGKWVAYGGEVDGRRHVFLQSTTGQTPIDLTADSNADDDQPAFSPDGERIAFRSSRDGGGIFVMGRTGESVRRVTNEGFKPTWSQDGQELAFATENADLDPQNTLGLSSLRVVEVASGEQRQVGKVDAVLPNWSPHGLRIAYTTRGAISGSTRLDIWTIDPSGSTPVAVTGDGASNSNPVWSPDGKYLYFVSGRAGPINLWRVPIDESSGETLGPPEPVTTPAASVAHFAISADGAYIAYSSIQRSRNVQKLAIDPASGKPRGEPAWVTTGLRLWANPDPSPDGKSVVFYASVASGASVYVARTDGTGMRQLTSRPETIDRMPRWSPDGTWIAFHSIHGKDQRLFKIRPDGSDLQQLSPLADAIYPAWSPDGTRIAVLMGAGIGHPENNVYILDPNRPWSAQTPEMIAPPADSIDEFVVNSWSPDGSRLAGQAGLDARGIITYAFQTRRFERLTDFGGYPVWLPDSRRLMFVSGGRDFFVVDTRSRKAEKVFSVLRDVIGPPQLTRDGREAYFSRRVTEGDIWMLAYDHR